MLDRFDLLGLVLFSCQLVLVQADIHSILGIHRSATIDEIKQAYHKLARLYHPDRNTNNDTTEKFIEITQAYNALISNHEKIKCFFKSCKRKAEDYDHKHQYTGNTHNDFNTHEGHTHIHVTSEDILNNKINNKFVHNTVNINNNNNGETDDEIFKELFGDKQGIHLHTEDIILSGFDEDLNL